MHKYQDGNILYDRISIEVDETGVYRIWWLDGERIAMKKVKDFRKYPE